MNLLFNLNLREMKKFFMCARCLATLLTACNNDVVEQLESESELKTKSVVETDTTDVLYITDEVWSELMSSHGEFTEYVNPQIVPMLSVESRTAVGYTSCTARSGKENVKCTFPADAFDKIGIPQGIYIVDFCEAKININLKTGEQFIALNESPNCGFKPDFEETRGYAMVMDGSRIVLTTYLTHIKYDMAGKNVNVWYPLIPENLKWDYSILVM